MINGSEQPEPHGEHPPSTSTSTRLLEQLMDPNDRSAWGDYVRRYRPIIVRFSRRFGLQPDEAEDAAQQVLAAFSQAYREGKYSRSQGRLRQWLFGIARKQILYFARQRRNREVQVAGRSDAPDFFAEVSDDDQMEHIWDQDWRDAVIRQCLQQIRGEVDEKTMQAFQLFVEQDWPAKKVSDHLGLSENAVYCAKRRILRRLRETLPQMDEDW